MTHAAKIAAVFILLGLMAGCDGDEPSATGAYTPPKADPCEKAAPVHPCV